MISDAEHDKLGEVWEDLYDRICDLLEQHGTEDPFGRSGDYWVVDDFWGQPQAKVYFFNLTLLRPPMIGLLQEILKSFPGWEIVATVDLPGQEKTLPDMGLFIHANDVVDDLRREYLPPEFQDYNYNNVNRSET